jgi:hypothetical protein
VEDLHALAVRAGNDAETDDQDARQPYSSNSDAESNPCKRRVGDILTRPGGTLNHTIVAQIDYAVPVRRSKVNALIAYLLENMILDFKGDLTLEQVREFLRGDEGRESRALLAKLVEDRGVSDMMITLADCLQDYIKTGITEDTVREQVRTYAES